MLVGGLGPPIHPLKSHTANMLYYTAKSTNNRLRLRNDLYCVEWGVKLYSLTHQQQFTIPVIEWLLRDHEN